MLILDRLRRSDAGFTLVELGVSIILSAVVATIMVGLVSSVSRSVTDQTERATTQQAVRTAIADLTRDLRQAVPAATGGRAVVELSADAIEFTTLDAESDGLVRVVIERTNCVSGACDLVIRRYASVGSGPPYTFDTTPFRDGLLAENIDGSITVFQGIVWSGSPAVRSTVAACGASGPRCDFDLVGINVRATAATTRDPELAFEIREEVRIRNA